MKRSRIEMNAEGEGVREAILLNRARKLGLQVQTIREVPAQRHAGSHDYIVDEDVCHGQGELVAYLNGIEYALDNLHRASKQERK